MSAPKIAWAWSLVAALGLNAAAQSGGVAAGEDQATFLGNVSSILAEAEIHRGLTGDAGYEAVRKYLRDAQYLRAREARILAAFGPSCASRELDNVLQSLVRDIDETSRSRIASYYLTTVQMTCSRRMRDDGALLSDLLAALEAGKAARLQRYERFVQEERAVALKEEEERRRRAFAAATPAQPDATTLPGQLAGAARNEAAAGVAPAQAPAAADPPAHGAPAESPSPVAQSQPKQDASRIAGTYECGAGPETRVLHLGASGEIVELISVGGGVLGFAGLYRVTRDRVTARFVADNTWKIFATKYDQSLPDDVAWKRSGIASQKVLEFRFVDAGAGKLQLERVRTKLLKSGEISAGKRRTCNRLAATHPVNRAVAAHARMAMPYVDKEFDAVPERLEDARLSLAREIEAKKRNELAWFQRAPGVLKMMATDRLLEELRTASDRKCDAPKAALETAAASAMGAINRIGESERAKANPEGAEALAGRQLDPVFAEFLDSAGRTQCIMAESSAVGL